MKWLMQNIRLKMSLASIRSCTLIELRPTWEALINREWCNSNLRPNGQTNLSEPGYITVVRHPRIFFVAKIWLFTGWQSVWCEWQARKRPYWISWRNNCYELHRTPHNFPTSVDLHSWDHNIRIERRFCLCKVLQLPFVIHLDDQASSNGTSLSLVNTPLSPQESQTAPSWRSAPSS